MQISLFQLLPSLMLFSHALKYDIRLSWLFKSDHLYFQVSLELDCFGQESFAYLALEFGEVVRNGDAISIFFDFAIDPVFQTPSMHQLAASLAGAWTDQRVTICGLVAQADFA